MEPAAAPWPTSPPPRPPEDCLCWAAWSPSCWPHCSGTAQGRGRTGPVEVRQHHQCRINVKVDLTYSARVKGHLIKTVEWYIQCNTMELCQGHWKTSSNLIIKQTTDVWVHLHNVCITESRGEYTHRSLRWIEGHFIKTMERCVIRWHVTRRNISIRFFQSSFKDKPKESRQIEQP